MTQLLSPQVSYIERDESPFISAVGSATAFFLAQSDRGAVNEPVFVAERNALLEGYGKPTSDNAALLAALVILQGCPLWLYRVSGADQAFANSTLQVLSGSLSIASGTIETPASGSTPATYSAATLTFTGSMNDGSSQVITADVVYSSSNPLVATVNASGVVTGVAAGQVTITATYNDDVTASIALSIEI